MTAYNEIVISYFKSDLGELILGSYNQMLCLCDWRFRKMRDEIDDRLKKGLSVNFVEGDSEIIQMAKSQLEEYFHGDRQEFEIPLLFIGSEFQKSVWQELRNIPFGKTMTYQELSRKLGNEKAIRAVAGANGANAITIIVPCHRIIGSKGEMIGYAGGLRVKKNLLKLEAKGCGIEQLELF